MIKWLSVLVSLISLPSILSWTTLPLGNTTVWWIVYATTLYFLWKGKDLFFNSADNKRILFVELYLCWNLICIVRGIFTAENYWEWKNLVGVGMVLFLPVSIYSFTNKNVVQRITIFWLKYALPVFFLITISFTQSDAIGGYLVPIGFLLLFHPLLETKWKVLIMVLSVFVLISLGARSNVIKFSASFLIGLLIYFPSLFKTKKLEMIRLFLMILPFIFFGLAVSGVFNIFKMNNYIIGEHKVKVMEDGKIKEESLITDTRTFLYVEVLSSALKHNYTIWGRTPARGNDSEAFGLYTKDELKTGIMERFKNEVSILNVFTWTGLIGVFLYFALFFKATYLAINRSNNSFIKVLGLYIAFRWNYAWVEDFTNFNLSSIYLWLAISMCYSSAFRSMDDIEFKYWVRGIFDVNYRNLYRKYQNRHLTKKLLNS